MRKHGIVNSAIEPKLSYLICVHLAYRLLECCIQFQMWCDVVRGCGNVKDTKRTRCHCTRSIACWSLHLRPLAEVVALLWLRTAGAAFCRCPCTSTCQVRNKSHRNMVFWAAVYRQQRSRRICKHCCHTKTPLHSWTTNMRCAP